MSTRYVEEMVQVSSRRGTIQVRARVTDAVSPGTVFLPPADRHLVVEGGRVRLDRGEPVCLQRPSGTVLFRSMARSLGAAALGVLLTGMGEDGAEGLRHLREVLQQAERSANAATGRLLREPVERVVRQPDTCARGIGENRAPARRTS